MMYVGKLWKEIDHMFIGAYGLDQSTDGRHLIKL